MKNGDITIREMIEVVARVLSIFLFSFLIFSILLGNMDVMSALPALSVTYIVVHFWEKHVARQNTK